MESHYCRETTKKMYLEEGLSVAKMYRLYLEDNQDKDVVSQQIYAIIFNYEFNLSFFKPKKDL